MRLTTLALLLVPVFTPAGRAEPLIVLDARRDATLRATAQAVEADVDRLTDLLTTALEPGRRGSAAVVDGVADPAPDLRQAGVAMRGSVDAAFDLGASVQQLQGTLSAVRPSAVPLPMAPAPADLLGIADQFDQAADAAVPFVERRRAATATVERIGDVLAALDRDDVDGALDRLAEARTARRTVAAWNDPPAVLPVWLDTTGRLISALDQLARATDAGDAAQVRTALRAYRAAAGDARQADSALAIAIAEAGSAVTDVPMRRLAEQLAMLEGLRQRVASVLLDAS